MASIPRYRPIDKSDEDLIAMLADPDVELVALLPAIAHALNDPSFLPAHLVPDASNPLAEQGGWDVEQQDEVRTLAAVGLGRLRDAKPRDEGPTDSASPELISAGIDWITGDSRSGDYQTMLAEELAPDGGDPRAPQWHRDDFELSDDISVVIVGAGMSGLLASHRLQQSGVPVTILEKNVDLGGTWHENTYPGCRVDVANHTYSYSFQQKFDWPDYNSPRAVLHEYFSDCADDWNVRGLIQFNTEVTAMTWSDATSSWTLEVVTPDGESTIEANVVISAVGQLNRPVLPAIDGRESYTGEWWHSARWPESIDLVGKRVAIIGTGSSASQFIPAVAEQAGSLTVFQRTANWLIPRPRANQAVADSMLWLFASLPHFGNWHRLGMFWRGHEGLRPTLVVDPDWNEDVEQSVSKLNQELRDMMLLYIEAEFADRPDLLDKVRPDHPIGAKRFVLDFGAYAEALKRDTVSLETTPISRITPTGIITDDDTEHEFDVIIYGTGFAASDFLMPMKITGRGGVELHDQWDGDARAYLGITAPNMPNLFMLYGPNTNIVINGSIIFFSECETHYVTHAVRELHKRGGGSLAVKAAVHDAYNERVDAGNLQMAWGVSNVSSWYKNATGRSAQNWPFTMLEYWQQTRNVEADDYDWT